jgi:hypothetical protein
MDIQTITSWLFIATMVLPLVGLPIYIAFKREKAPDELKRPSPAASAWSIGIAAVLGYCVGVSVGIGVSCSPGAGNLCGLAGYFIYGPLFAIAAAILAPLILYASGRQTPNSSDPNDSKL